MNTDIYIYIHILLYYYITIIIFIQQICKHIYYILLFIRIVCVSVNDIICLCMWRCIPQFTPWRCGSPGSPQTMRIPKCFSESPAAHFVGLSCLPHKHNQNNQTHTYTDTPWYTMMHHDTPIQSHTILSPFVPPLYNPKESCTIIYVLSFSGFTSRPRRACFSQCLSQTTLDWQGFCA